MAESNPTIIIVVVVFLLIIGMAVGGLVILKRRALKQKAETYKAITHFGDAMRPSELDDDSVLEKKDTFIEETNKMAKPINLGINASSTSINEGL